MDQWRDSPQGREKSGAAICLLLACLCLNFLSCSCNGEKTKKQAEADDVTVVDDDSTPPDDDDDGGDVTENDDESPTAGDDTAIEDDDDSSAPPACQDAVTFKTFPDAYDKFEDLPCNAWEPRMGCEEPDIPLVLVKYTPLENSMVNQPDEWPFNDPNIILLDDFPNSSGMSIHHGMVAWSRPNISNYPITRFHLMGTNQFYELPSAESLCRESSCDSALRSFSSPVVSSNTQFAAAFHKYADTKILGGGTFIVDLESNCAMRLILNNGSNIKSSWSDAADSPWYEITTVSNDSEYDYDIINSETGESYDFNDRGEGMGHFSISGKYMLHKGGRDPLTNEITYPAYLFDLEKRKDEIISDGTLIQCSKQFTRTHPKNVDCVSV
jgi:hypothetical protein